MTEVRAVTLGQRIRAERARARARAESAAAAERVREDGSGSPRRDGFERGPTPGPADKGLSPDLQFQAQTAAEHRRGLRAGPLIHGAARRTYLGTEYAGPADRRARVGRVVRSSV